MRGRLIGLGIRCQGLKSKCHGGRSALDFAAGVLVRGRSRANLANLPQDNIGASFQSLPAASTGVHRSAAVIASSFQVADDHDG